MQIVCEQLWQVAHRLILSSTLYNFVRKNTA